VARLAAKVGWREESIGVEEEREGGDEWAWRVG
jgi:hypothetical protein